MCGIAGILHNANIKEFDIGPMLGIMKHRGPDDFGTHSDAALSLGVRRLSIIDIGGGHQPIYNEDKTIVTAFNGEIYNYIELREYLKKKGHIFYTQADTEVLVHLYEDEGTDFLKRLNGMFGLAIWDTRKHRLIIARDRIGEKPIYYATTKDLLIFASEMKCILASRLLTPSLDTEALFDYFSYLCIPGEKTPFREIRKLLPGHMLVAENNRVTIRQWWSLSEHTSLLSISKEKAKNHLRELLFDSVRLQMRSDVPVGSLLSGGMDSSLITAIAAQQTNLPLNSFSVGFSDTQFDELPYAREVAQRCKTEHRELTVSPADLTRVISKIVWHMDEPNGDSAVLPSYMISELSSRHVKVVLSGLGGDELFGGYGRYIRGNGKISRLAILPRWVLKMLYPVLLEIKREWGKELNDKVLLPIEPWLSYFRRLDGYGEQDVKRLLPGIMREGENQIKHLFDKYKGGDPVNCLLFVDAQTYLPDEILALTDRMSMAVSLEVRVPFLDYRLVEFVSGLPGNWKVAGRDQKMILKETMKDLLPGAVLARRKWGFASPVTNWMQKNYLNRLLDLCRNSELAKAGIVDAQAIQVFVNDPEAKKRKSKWLWMLLMLEMWYRTYNNKGNYEVDWNSIGTTEHSKRENDITSYC